MWGFITVLNDILIPYLKAVFELTYFEAMLVQFAFFGAYFVGGLLYFIVSVNVGDPINKIGYKNGIILGLVISAIGTSLFFPAAQFVMYGFFLSALFVLGLGFAMLQRSLWMTPHDVTRPLREFLESEQLVPEVYVLEAKRLFAGDDRLLARQIWPLKELSLAYESWLGRVEKVGKDDGARQELREEFLGILKADPCLPKELLPEGWAGEKAAERFKRL